MIFMAYIKCGFNLINNNLYHDLEECGDERRADDILLWDGVSTEPATETAEHSRSQPHVISLRIQNSNLYAAKQYRSINISLGIQNSNLYAAKQYRSVSRLASKTAICTQRNNIDEYRLSQWILTKISDLQHYTVHKVFFSSIYDTNLVNTLNTLVNCQILLSCPHFQK